METEISYSLKGAAGAGAEARNAAAAEALARLRGPRWPMADAHIHAVDFTQKGPGLRELLAQMDRANVTKATVFGMPVTKQHLETERDRPVYYLDDESPAYYYSMTDAALAEDWLSLSASERERIWPTVCGFNPADRYAVEHVERMFRTYPGVFRGIGEVFFRHDDLTLMIPGEAPRPNGRAMWPVYEFASEYGVPFMLHHNVTSVGVSSYPKYLHELEEVLREFPKMTTVFCHCGVSRRVNAPYYARMIDRLLREYPRLHVDYSWVAYDDMICDENGVPKQEWVELTEKHSERILLGSDVIGNFERVGAINYRFELLLEKLSDRARENVATRNAERLWGRPLWRVETGRPRPYPGLPEILD